METEKRETKEMIVRSIVFLVGLFLSGVGVAVTKTGNLGVSPVSSVPNVLSIRFTWFTMGNWLIVWNCALILGQVILRRRDFEAFQFLQVPLSFLFGYFTDFGMWMVKWVPMDAYGMRLLFVILGTVILGLGISIAFRANVIMNSGEAFVKAVSDTIHKDFGSVKIGFDIANVLLSIVLSMLFFAGRIEGAREGTLIAAVCTGLVVKFFNPILKKPLDKLFHLFT